MVPKFRAWDEKNHEFFISGSDGTLSNLLCCDDWDMFNPDDYVWEQSTGLKDVNGKEIYENDIIVTHPKYADEEPKHGIVKYGSCRAEFSYKVRNGDHRSIWSSGEYRTYEVIGNMHENPELLEAQHD